MAYHNIVEFNAPPHTPGITEHYKEAQNFLGLNFFGNKKKELTDQEQADILNKGRARTQAIYDTLPGGGKPNKKTAKSERQILDGLTRTVTRKNKERTGKGGEILAGILGGLGNLLTGVGGGEENAATGTETGLTVDTAKVLDDVVILSKKRDNEKGQKTLFYAIIAGIVIIAGIALMKRK